MGLYDVTVQDVIRKNAVYRRDELALVCGDKRLTFGEYAREVSVLACGLAKLGVKKGDRIGVLAFNCHEFFILYGAAAMLGAIMLPINWRLTSEEIQVILEDCTPHVMVAGPEYTDVVAGLANRCAFLSHLLVMGGEAAGFQNLEALKTLSSGFQGVGLGQQDPFLIIHTAAVEGRPRGAVLTHGNLIAANLQSMLLMGIQGDTAHLNTLPLFHIAGFGFAFQVMHAGGRNVIMKKFDVQEALDWIEKERVTFLGTFPPMLSTLLDQAEASARSLVSLRVVAGLDNPETIQRFLNVTDAEFWTGFGQTETSGLCTFFSFDERPGSAGKEGPLVRVRVVDEYDQEVPDGQLGEIVVQGPTVFKKYWNLQQETAFAFRGGWHHTGDMGRLDEDGYLWYVKRKAEKELIKPGGENVYPVEVEQALLEHPDVLEACVFGVLDKAWGEAIKAVCVCRKGSDLEPEALIEFVASRIARYKKPKYLSMVEALPKDEDGYVDREKVKSEHGQCPPQ
jgi:acyl-CoA synthetase (AMP-forming)/AMP-acid ligase II